MVKTWLCSIIILIYIYRVYQVRGHFITRDERNQFRLLDQNQRSRLNCSFKRVTYHNTTYTFPLLHFQVFSREWFLFLPVPCTVSVFHSLNLIMFHHVEVSNFPNSQFYCFSFLRKLSVVGRYSEPQIIKIKKIPLFF